MQYQIENNLITLGNNQLFINGQQLSSKQRTLDALKLFLGSSNKVLTKDEIMNALWGKSIVTESSIFKQIVVLRKLLISHGLPSDLIETVYAKGYKFKYPIIAISDDNNIYPQDAGVKSTQYKDRSFIAKTQKTSVQKKTAQSQSSSKAHFHKSRLIKTGLLLLVSSLIYLLVILLVQNNQNNSSLSKEKKKSLEVLLKQDWSKGLYYLDQMIIQQSADFTDADKGYLYSQKGRAQLQLQKPNQSIESLKKSLLFVTDKQDIAEIYVWLARAYSSAKKMDLAMQSIDKSIKVLDGNPNRQMVASLMTKSLLLRKLGYYDHSIEFNENSMSMAQKIKDHKGEMIAVNNLSTTYHYLGQLEKALALNQLGVELSLNYGTSQHIANAYNANSVLQLLNNNIVDALKMIEMSLKYQVTNKNIRYLAPKMANYIELLIAIEQYEYAEKMLILNAEFNQKAQANASTLGEQAFLKGLKYLKTDQINNALIYFLQAQNHFQTTHVNSSLIELYSYYAMAFYFNDNHLKSLELSKLVLQGSQVSQRQKFRAYLSLSLTYLALNQAELSQEYRQKAQSIINDKWYYEAQIYYNTSSFFNSEKDDTNGKNHENMQIKLNQLRTNFSLIKLQSQPDVAIYQSIKKMIESL